ncbi:MAG: hypothetical protein SF028_00450 [Candidatus Sumerlaeia bacterium]|nr:hypothetical protein [Candidatus Sumerlaeia bacterium]
MDKKLEVITRSLVVAAVAGLLAFTWGLTGFGKITSPGVPEWFVGTFGETILAKFPGMFLSYYSIAILEVLGALIAVGSLLRGEWLPGRKASVLSLALAHSVVVFAQLGFGKRLIADHDGAHDLFMYAAGALAMLVAVRLLDHWQSESPLSGAA